MVKVKPVQNGRTTRMSFSRINEVIGHAQSDRDPEKLLQLVPGGRSARSLPRYCRDRRTITGNLVLEFVDYRWTKTPNIPLKNVRSGTLPMRRPCRSLPVCLNKETGEVKEQEIFMGDFPLMTDPAPLSSTVPSASSFPSWFVLPACSTAQARTVPARSCSPPP